MQQNHDRNPMEEMLAAEEAGTFKYSADGAKDEEEEAYKDAEDEDDLAAIVGDMASNTKVKMHGFFTLC